MCYDNADGIMAASAGNLGVAYFGGQTHIFLSKFMYEKRIGKQNFETITLEIFGRDALIRPGYFSEEQIFQIELPSLVVYPSDHSKKAKIDPERKMNGLVKLINRLIINKK